MKRFIVLFLLSSSMFAQDAPPSGGIPSRPPRIVTRTRTVAIFSDLEQQLMEARRKHDRATLEKLTADDFEVRQSSTPNPVPREEWLQEQARGALLGDFHPSDMAVHLYNDRTAVVNFFYGAGTVRFFVVDVWNKDGETWRLSVRYSAPAGSKAASADRKPDGKQ